MCPVLLMPCVFDDVVHDVVWVGCVGPWLRIDINSLVYCAFGHVSAIAMSKVLGVMLGDRLVV